MSDEPVPAEPAPGGTAAGETMSTVSDEPPSPDAPATHFRRRWDRGWALVPYGLVGVAAAIALLDPASTATERWAYAGACAGLLAWHGWFVTAHPEWPERRTVPMVVYFAGLLGAGTAFAAHPAFLVVVTGCYATAFIVLPGRWSYAGIVVTSVCLAWVIAGPQPPTPDLLARLLLVTVLAAGIGWSIRRLENEADRRHAVNEELHRAYRDLSELTARNEDLQVGLLARERADAVTAERARLARELHDTLAQSLVGITTRLEVAAELLDPAHPAHPHVDGAATLARSGLVEARRSVEGLRPEPLERLPLLAAIADVAAEWRARTGVAVRVDHTGDPTPVAADAEDALLRLVQECLANTERHAGASTVAVTVSFLGDVVAVDVHDDGSGFDPSLPRSGFGLRAMRERVTGAGGTVSVESAPGAGATVNATVPVR